MTWDQTYFSYQGSRFTWSFPCMQSETKPEPDLKSPERGEQAKSQFILAF